MKQEDQRREGQRKEDPGARKRRKAAKLCVSDLLQRACAGTSCEHLVQTAVERDLGQHSSFYREPVGEILYTIGEILAKETCKI